MYFNFETLLTLATMLSGILWLIDSLFFAKKRLMKQGLLKLKKTGRLREFIMVYGGIRIPGEVKMPKLIEYARSFFPILLLVLLLRTEVYEPYRIPSGSDKPTLLIGDLILVNKHIYGWRLPITNKQMVANHTPQLGDIVVFRWSVRDPSKDLIKRVVGMPGDHVSYIDKVLYINGIKVPQTLIGETTDTDGTQVPWPVLIKREDLRGISHLIYQRPDAPAVNFEAIIPAGSYFVMGDNRDDSNDSRYWGPVSEQDLKGKATYIWLSWNGFSDGILHVIRLDRIGTKIQ